MNLTTFLQGFLLGLAIAAPPGAIGVLCINRTLRYGRRLGFLSGLGAATADGLYGCLAGFGLTGITTLVLGYQRWFHLLGGLILCYIGLQTLRARPAIAPTPTPAPALPGYQAYASTFGLTLANPTTILAFTALFTSLEIVPSPTAAGLLVSGLVLGSACWWLLLSVGVSLLGRRLPWACFRGLNYLASLVFLAWGCLALARFLRA